MLDDAGVMRGANLGSWYARTRLLESNNTRDCKS